MTDTVNLDWAKRLTTEERLRTALEGYEAAAKRCVVLLRPVVLTASEATDEDRAALDALESMVSIGRGEADRVMMLASRSLDDAYADRHRALNGRAGARALVGQLTDALEALLTVTEGQAHEPAHAEARRVARLAARTRELWRRKTWWWLGGEKQLPEDEQKPKRLSLVKGGQP